MKHNPLCDGDNAFLGLIQGRELGLDSVIGVGHCEDKARILGGRWGELDEGK